MTGFGTSEIYHAVLEELPNGVFWIDCDRKIHFWNYGAERITGYLRQEMVGRIVPGDTFHTAVGAEFNTLDQDCPLLAAIREVRPIQTEAYLRHKKGHSVPVRLRVIPLRNEDSRVIGAAACFDENAAASEWNRRRAKLAEFGCLDEDTGVPNREFVLTQLRECLDIFVENHVPFGILIIDVNRMDYLRAAYGQLAATKMLRVVAQTLENSVRPTDCLGFWEESRFLAILKECKAVEFTKIGARLEKMVRCSETDWWGDKLPVTVSIGGAAAQRDDSVESILARARQALLQSTGHEVDSTK